MEKNRGFIFSPGSEKPFFWPWKSLEFNFFNTKKWAQFIEEGNGIEMLNIFTEIFAFYSFFEWEEKINLLLSSDFFLFLKYEIDWESNLENSLEFQKFQKQFFSLEMFWTAAEPFRHTGIKMLSGNKFILPKSQARCHSWFGRHRWTRVQGGGGESWAIGGLERSVSIYVWESILSCFRKRVDLA